MTARQEILTNPRLGTGIQAVSGLVRAVTIRAVFGGRRQFTQANEPVLGLHAGDKWFHPIGPLAVPPFELVRGLGPGVGFLVCLTAGGSDVAEERADELLRVRQEAGYVAWIRVRVRSWRRGGVWGDGGRWASESGCCDPRQIQRLHGWGRRARCLLSTVRGGLRQTINVVHSSRIDCGVRPVAAASNDVEERL